MASNSTSSERSSARKDDLDEILTCGICLCRMSSPCCLPCAHSFCRSCLLDYAGKSNAPTARPMNYILCPFCKSRLDFRSLEHLQTLLIINPTLNQLCEMLHSSKSSSTQGTSHARCHTCSSMESLKICKHCSYMLCQKCRQKHLLDVHQQCQSRIEILHSCLQLVDDKHRDLQQVAQGYDRLRETIRVYVDGLMREIEQQRIQALQIIDERQHANEEAFWARNGFENMEKFKFFTSLLEAGKEKLFSEKINDRDLIKLSEDLQTIPDITEDTLASIVFPKLSVQFDQTIPIKQLIHLYDNPSSTTASEALQGDLIEQIDVLSKPSDETNSKTN